MRKLVGPSTGRITDLGVATGAYRGSYRAASSGRGSSHSRRPGGLARDCALRRPHTSQEDPGPRDRDPGGKRLHNPPKPAKTPPRPGPRLPRRHLGSHRPRSASHESCSCRSATGSSCAARPCFSFSYGGNRYRIPHATITLKCRSLRIGNTAASPATRVLAVDLESGEVRVRAGSHARKAVVVSRRDAGVRDRQRQPLRRRAKSQNLADLRIHLR